MVGVAVGNKDINNIDTNVVSIKVYVKNKMSKEAIIKKYGVDGIIPRTVDSVRTDVVHVGNIEAQAYTNKIRPIAPGYSVGHPAITAGTIGGFFKDSDDDVVILGNNHVLANVNNCNICDLCVQPGPLDMPPSPFIGWIRPVIALEYIGHLKRFVRLEANGNVQDSAIVKVHPDLINNSGFIVSYPDGIESTGNPTDPVLGMNVIKFGRTTEMTTGTVTALNGTFSVNFGAYGTKAFNDCVVLTPMSAGGDSGSVIMRNEAGQDRVDVGLLFAGSPTVTLCNRITTVYDTYGLSRI